MNQNGSNAIGLSGGSGSQNSSGERFSNVSGAVSTTPFGNFNGGGMSQFAGGGFQNQGFTNQNFGPGGPNGTSLGGMPGGNGPTGAFDKSSTDLTDVKTAIDALRSELQDSVSSDATPTHASIGTLMDDLDAIRGGTLAGTDATTKVQADELAVLNQLGLTSDQITAIQSDEAALVSAINTALSSSTDSSSDSSSSTDNSSDVTSPRNPLQDMADVPLLSFLSSLRQNQSPHGSDSSGSSSSDNTSST